MIEILLPVYNGEKYLREQLDSIIAQTNQDWILKIRNDGSIDNSQIIIDEYSSRFPDKIVIIPGNSQNLGLLTSLNLLLETANKANYIMFADQDDIWLPNKINISLSAVSELEHKHRDQDIPIMICTDAICVDQYLNIIHNSFHDSQKFLPNIIGNKYKMLALNQVQGCTIMVNKSAYNVIYPMPSCMKIHDMWIGVICAHYGIAKYIPQQTLLYRQHSQNTLGGQNIGFKYYLSRIHSIPYLLTSRSKLFKKLPFKVSYLRWILTKMYYNIKRLL